MGLAEESFGEHEIAVAEETFAGFEPDFFGFEQEAFGVFQFAFAQSDDAVIPDNKGDGEVAGFEFGGGVHGGFGEVEIAMVVKVFPGEIDLGDGSFGV